MRLLVTGATGYVGGRLVPRLLAEGHEVRCLVRNPAKLDQHPWRDSVEVVAGDVLEARSLKEAAAGCDAAYYLVHQMATGSGFERLDRRGAENFARAAEEAGLHRIVYLGGLLSDEGRPPAHLDSRREVGEILASGTTPVTWLRAAVIIGSGSLSFEMLRYLTEVLPVMTAPRWARTRCQPIAVRDVIDALTDATRASPDGNEIIDLGGPDILTYAEMMRIYSQEAELRKRLVIPLPFRSPRLSSLWVGLVTPLPPAVARPLVESLRHEVLARPELAPRRHPTTSFRAAVRRALGTTPTKVVTRWTDAESSPAHPGPGDPTWSGGTIYVDRRIVPTDTEACHLYWAFSRIGGSVGYYGLNWAWRVRGFLDRMIGGVGLRRGRRHPTELRVGDAVDFWRVEELETGVRLRLHSEMRLPGEAWLEWEAVEADNGTDLVQTATFRPRGLLGRAYWFSMLPAHRTVFPTMSTRIAAVAEERGYSCP